MPDVFTKAKRSQVMSRIRGRGNKETELAFARLLRKSGITGRRRQRAIRVNVQRSTFNVQHYELDAQRFSASARRQACGQCQSPSV